MLRYSNTSSPVDRYTSSTSSLSSAAAGAASASNMAGGPYYDEKKELLRGGGLLEQVTNKRNRRPVLITAGVLLTFILWNTFTGFGGSHRDRPSYRLPPETFNQTKIPHLAFQPPEDHPYRIPDSVDTFEKYKFRDMCDISSLDLHLPFSPLCQDRQSMLNAMSWGGRIGHDAPYMPRGCDMRWFTTEEICEILSRFQKVIIIGDSMMRHIIGSINVLIRRDLGYGAVTDWNFSPEERRDCFCNYQFNVKACSIQGIFRTADVVRHDPESLACDAKSIDVNIEVMVRHPIPEDELRRYRDLLGQKKPAKPYAWIFGHGLWNDLDLQAHLNWMDKLLETTRDQLPYLKNPDALWPRLVVTPNAAGVKKPDEWLVSQGNKALSMYEEGVRIEDGKRGVEHLGTFNMSVQANMYDGGHCDLRGNLIKAMMVLNWLNMIDVDKH